jgi:hypothetical protein
VISLNGMSLTIVLWSQVCEDYLRGEFCQGDGIEFVGPDIDLDCGSVSGTVAGVGEEVS